MELGVQELVSVSEPELLASLHSAAKRCGRRKQSRHDVMAYRLNEGEVLVDLAARISQGSYVPAPGRVFVTERPKHREIHAADYPDRIVHHLLHDLLAPHFEPHFIADTFACIPGRGTHAAARRLQAHVWNATRHGGIRAYALQLDVRSFFPSIHKPTLLARIEPLTRSLPPLARNPRALTAFALATVIIEHDCSRAARVAPARAFARVPAHKRLGAHGPECGLPIGNLTSQFFANVYLDPLDHFVTRGLGFTRYVRYVDDLVLVDPDPQRLVQARDAIAAFCAQRLRLALHPGAEPFSVSEGIDFVGYVVRPRYLLPRRRVVQAFRSKLKAAEASVRRATLQAGESARLASIGWVRGPLRLLRVDGDAPEQLRAAWSSYEGHFAHASAHRLRARLWASAAVTQRVLRRRGVGVALRFARPRPARNLRDQRTGLGRGLRGAALLLRVGRWVLLPAWAGRKLNLRPRSNYGARFCVPFRQAGRHAAALVRLGYRVALAVERPWAHGVLKRRELRYLLEPVASEWTDRRSPAGESA